MFDHKGYWFYGANREKEELKLFKKLIIKGSTVLEVGAHIGYLTSLFEDLVGIDGRILAIEPTPSSLRYLKKNIRPSTIIVEKAAGNISGKVEFFTEELGGFTNSLDSEFTRRHSLNSSVNSIIVEVDKLDNICNQNNFYPNFIKIDVEGAEYSVLKGAKKILKNADALMIEININKDEIFSFLNDLGFKKLDCKSKSNNYFFIIDR